MTIKGLFDGHNKSTVTYSQELYENTAITDIPTLQNFMVTQKTQLFMGRNLLCNSGQELG